ncbi:hypothetical protein YB2330_003240 [Saitoella coloradoensis]
MALRLTTQRLPGMLARPAVARVAATAVRHNSTPARPEPSKQAASIIDALPGNSILSKTGILTAATAVSALLVSNEFYVVNEETVVAISFLGSIAMIAKLGGPAYSEWAQEKINRIKSVLVAAREEHVNAVRERIESVSNMKDVVESTKGLFAVSKETAQLEAKAFELEQKVAFASEAKSVLDSWVRYETSVRQREQRQLADSIIAKIQKELGNPKFQQQLLAQSVAEVERIVSGKQFQADPEAGGAAADKKSSPVLTYAIELASANLPDESDKHNLRPRIVHYHGTPGGSGTMSPIEGVMKSDIELGAIGKRLKDPLLLQDRLVSDEQLETRFKSPRSCITGREQQRGDQSKLSAAVRKFYKQQNENIHALLKPIEEHRKDADTEMDNDLLKVQIAIRGSFIANIILAILQVYAGAASGSLSLIATMADAIFDPLSNLTLVLAHRTASKASNSKWPSGTARMETVGNVTFCFIMSAVSLVIIVESIRALVEGGDGATEDLHIPSIIAVAIAFATKFTLFLYCFGFRQYSQVRILWEDHRNDLFVNGFGLFTSIAGSKIAWWLDPTGAIIISVLVLGLWMYTAYHEMQLLIGISADPQFLQLVTYNAMTHDPSVLQVDTCRAYHAGPKLVVEVDIVMDPAVSLRESHDVAESLQEKLELLPDVERAYVHVDFETSHKPEHRKIL